MASLVLSADSHVLEPADLWTTRMQPKYRDRAPHLVHEHKGMTGGDYIACAELGGSFNPASLGSAGIPPEQQAEFERGGYRACRPGGWDPVERIKDMDADGIRAEIIYCGYGMALFGHPDDAFQRDAHRAYNDWVHEYASHDPKRLLPIANISMTDPVEDLKELARIKRLGFRGIFISNDPLAERRYDNPMWEPFWCAVEEYDLPVNIHILTAQGRWGVGENHIVEGVLMLVPAFRTIAEMITGGVLERHPGLKVISVENDIGWLPNFLKRMRWYAWRTAARYPHLPLNAADYWRRQVYSTFQDDIPGMRCLEMIGAENLLWGSDYPHFDSTFPHSREAIERNFTGISQHERELILGGNMARVYNLHAFLPQPARESSAA